MNIGIWGISGFLGTELAKIFSQRPEIKIVYTVTSKKNTGNIKDVDIGFLALKSEQSMEIAPELLRRGIRVIDLSGAFRIKNISDFAKYYQLNQTQPESLDVAIYGSPEKNRDEIRNAQLVANPGCYATAVNLGLLPLLNNGLISPETRVLVRAVSGYTGAGRKVKIPKTITSYKNGRQHQHIPEIEQELNIKNRLLFFPSIAPWPRGIGVDIYVHTSIKLDVFNLYKQFYRDELFVRIKHDKAEIDDIIGTNFCDIIPKTNGSIAVIKVVIDNLGKGGSGQAVQNFNIMCGFPEKLIY